MLRIICLLGCLFFTTSCKQNPVDNLEVVEIKDEDGNLAEKYSRRKANFFKEGEATKFFPNGKIMETAFYANDTLEGKRSLFYENGQVQFEEHYKNGAFHGSYTAYYEDGNLELEGVYDNGKMSGEWKRYYKSGQLMEIVTFANNQENGPFTEFYENGKIKAEGGYLDGDNEHGPLKMYDETGTLVKTMNCEKGICRTTWKMEGLAEDI